MSGSSLVLVLLGGTALSSLVDMVFGRQGEEEISAEEVAALAGTINYEVVTPNPPTPPPPVAGRSPRCPGQ
jgi:hypothetical protein